MSGRYPTFMAPPNYEARAMPRWRSRTIVSPETMNSSMSTFHGPMASRPALATRQRRRALVAHRDVVVEHRGLAVEQEP